MFRKVGPVCFYFKAKRKFIYSFINLSLSLVQAVYQTARLQLYGEFLNSINWRESAELSPKLKDRLEKVIYLPLKLRGKPIQSVKAENEVNSMIRKIRTQGTQYAETVESEIDTFIMQNTDVSPILQIVLFFRTVLSYLEPPQCNHECDCCWFK